MGNNISSGIIAVIMILATAGGIRGQSPVTIQPDQPEHGDTLTVVYEPQTETSTRDTLHLTFEHGNLFSLPNQLSMQQSNGKWTTSFQLPGYVDYFGVNVKTPDDSTLATGEVLVHKDGIPAKSALKRKRLYESHPALTDLSKEKRDSVSLYYNRKIQKYYPDDFASEVNIMSLTAPDDSAGKAEVRQKIRSKIKQRQNKNPGSRDTYIAVMEGYDALGKDLSTLSDSISKQIARNHPNSEVASRYYYTKTRELDSLAKAVPYHRKIIENDHNPRYRINAYQQLFNYYSKQGQADSAAYFARKWYESLHPGKAHIGERIARRLATDSLKLDLALKYGRKAKKQVDNEPYKPWYRDGKYYSHYADSAKLHSFRKGLEKDLHALEGYVLLQQQKLDQAESILSSLLEENSDHEPSQKYLAKLYRRTDQNKKAFDLYRKLLLDEPTDSTYQANFQRTYIAYNGSEDGLEQKKAAIDSAWRVQMRKKFRKKQKNKKIPPLKSVTSLQGDTLTSRDLRGEIVVIDFWESWCGPCKSAFPHLQKVYEQYKDHPEVRFVVLNSAWSDTLKEAKAWMDKQDYTFPVYFDHDSKTADAYNIRGIPTTLVLDRKNRLQFRKVGFEGPVMQRKLALQIDMLLEGKP